MRQLHDRTGAHTASPGRTPARPAYRRREESKCHGTRTRPRQSHGRTDSVERGSMAVAAKHREIRHHIGRRAHASIPETPRRKPVERRSITHASIDATQGRGQHPHVGFDRQQTPRPTVGATTITHPHRTMPLLRRRRMEQRRRFGSRMAAMQLRTNHQHPISPRTTNIQTRHIRRTRYRSSTKQTVEKLRNRHSAQNDQQVENKRGTETSRTTRRQTRLPALGRMGSLQPVTVDVICNPKLST